MNDNNLKAFLALVRGGLWEQDVQLVPYSKIDFSVIHKMAEEQSVVGLVTAGLDHMKDVKVPQDVVLTFIGSTLQVEQRNKLMNDFIADIVTKMRDESIYTLLVKGQGVAKCYEKPLWRSSGDVDLLLSEGNYQKAKAFLLPLSSGNKKEEVYSKHLGMHIGPWYVESHGSLRSGLSEKVDKEIDAVQNSVFYDGNVRSWMNGNTQVFLPAVDEDVFLVFTHFIKHFYKEGLGLRQVCDWCRLLWTYRDEIDEPLLIGRLQKAGLMEEWKAFAALAVDNLGMPVEAMPLLNENESQNGKLKRKAERILGIILAGSTGSKVRDTWRIAKVFPWHTIQFAPSIFIHLNWMKVKERVFGNGNR